MPDTSVTPRKAPVQSRSRATYEAVLEAGAQVLTTRGLASVTTERVAERAGVSIGTLYQYFPGKEAIVAELVRRMRAEMLADLTGALEEIGEAPLSEGARRLIAASIRHHQRAPELAAALEMAEASLPLDAESAALKAEIGERLAGYLARHGVAEPAIAARDLSAICRSMVDAAIADGETDVTPVTERIERAVAGYLGLR